MAPTANLGHVAVIGGCGFIGYHIVQLLLERYPSSTTVSVLDLRITANRVQDSRVSYHAADITDLPGLQALFAKLKPAVVIHTAAIIPDSRIPQKVIYKVNVDGTKNVVEAARGAGVRAFVFTSSSSVVVGESGDVHNADETLPVLVGEDQPEYYSRTKVHPTPKARDRLTTKAIAETAVLEANRSPPSFLTCAVRPVAPFGEGDMMLTSMLKITGVKTYFQIGSNDNLFDITYVANVAHAHLLAAEALLATQALRTQPLDTERVDGEAFFASNGTPAYFWDFTRAVWAARDSPADRAFDVRSVWVLGATVAMLIATVMEAVMGLFGKAPNFTRIAVKASSRTRYFSIEKARKRLGYEPLVSVQEGLKRSVGPALASIQRQRESAKNK
jgi:sterol-4alpha-carboxylate 3-dehydrogenase (decarboxylating)